MPEDQGTDTGATLQEQQTAPEQGTLAGGDQQQAAPEQHTLDDMPPVGDANAEQRFQSWLGRRDAKLREEFEQRLGQTAQYIISAMQQQQAQRQPVQPSPDQPQQSYYDPEQEAAILSVLDKRESARQAHLNAVRGAANWIYHNDPFLRDNPEIGNEVLTEASRMNVDHRIDPQIMASTIMNTAKANVLSRKIGKTNAFSGRTPQNLNAGGVTPSTTKTPSNVSKITDMERDWGRKMGFTEEQIAETLYGDK